MAKVEEELVVERSRCAELRSQLERERERAQDLTDALAQLRQSSSEGNRELARQVERLQASLDGAVEDRRAAMRELELARDSLGREAERAKEEARNAEAANDALRRSAKRSETIQHQMENAFETAQCEVRLLKDRIDEHVAMACKATADSKQALDETRRVWEERIEAVTQDYEARLSSAAERVKTAEHDRNRSEAAKQASARELARLQLTLEERLAQTERSVREEQAAQFNLQLEEVTARLEAVQNSREMALLQSREHGAQLEKQASRAAAEAREFSRELAEANEGIEVARDTCRLHEGKVGKLEMECASLQRKVKEFERRCEQQRKDKSHFSEMHKQGIASLELQHAAQLKDAEQLISDGKVQITALEGKVQEAGLTVAALRQQQLHHLTSLEKSLAQSLASAFDGTKRIMEQL
ncbi:unnamed protein product [Chrysoparadoxa australica]